MKDRTTDERQTEKREKKKGRDKNGQLSSVFWLNTQKLGIFQAKITSQELHPLLPSHTQVTGTQATEQSSDTSQDALVRSWIRSTKQL